MVAGEPGAGGDAASSSILNVRIPAPHGLTAPVDIMMRDGRIAKISAAGTNARSGGDGDQVVDGAGRIAMPGLVDVHCHGAAAVFDPDIQLALLRQGVTSILVGQDGIGYAPSDRASFEWSCEYFAGIDGATPRVGPGRFADWLRAYDGATPLNVGAFVPHGSLRYLVMGAAQRPANTNEIVWMARVLRNSLAAGALGLATGLEYVPAAWASRDELVALLREVRAARAVHNSHMRGYEALAPGAVAELIELALAAGGTDTHIAHYHGESGLLGSLLDDFATARLSVTFDSYPYLRGCSLLAMVSLPTWLPLADPAACLRIISNDDGAPGMSRSEILGKGDGDATGSSTARIREHLAGLDDLWPRTTLAWVSGDDPATGKPMGWVAGLTVPEVAARLCVSAPDAVLRLLVASKLQAICVFAQPPTNSEASVLALANRPEHLGASDAIYVPFGAASFSAESRPHPRGWGAMARWIALRTPGTWSWHDAAGHLSARAARRFGLGRRGVIEPGAVADLFLVDPARLRDTATYEAPRSLAEGIDDVWVAGSRVLAGGALTGATPGAALRRGRTTTTDTPAA